MQKMNRRYFCGTSLLALPLTRVFAREKDGDIITSVSDPVMDSLSDEFVRTTIDGTKKGFGSEHFHRYAGQIRIFNANLEDKGTNSKMNKRLDDDDYYLLNPDANVASTRKYWKQRGILFDENYLMKLAAVDVHSYNTVRKAIKKQGGVQALHELIAVAFEHKAEEYASIGFQSGLTIHNGFLHFPASSGPAHADVLMNVQLEMLYSLYSNLFGEMNIDCLCKAMSVEGAVLAILCATICQPCCVPAALMLAFVTLMESLGYCSSDQC